MNLLPKYLPQPVARLAFLLLLTCAAPTFADPAVDSPEFRSVVLVVPGETGVIGVCWDQVPGGRLPCVHFTDSPERPAENSYPESGDEQQLGSITVSVDPQRTRQLYEALDRREFPSQPGTVVQVVKFVVAADAPPGNYDIYAHYIAGTGRTTYRRAALRVVIRPSQEEE